MSLGLQSHAHAHDAVENQRQKADKRMSPDAVGRRCHINFSKSKYRSFSRMRVAGFQ